METHTAKYFDFLDELRASGKANMFGAGPYLMQEFGMDKDEAIKVLLDWMVGFEKPNASRESVG